MHIGRRPPLATRTSWAAGMWLALGGLFIIGCDRPASDSIASSSATPRTKATAAGVILRADPNPVPAGTVVGKTTITWDTGSDATGDVYLINAGNERLFANSPKGSQDAPWIAPGSTEFRLYNHADHKLLAQLTVTMPLADASASSPMPTPVLSPSP